VALGSIGVGYHSRRLWCLHLHSTSPWRWWQQGPLKCLYPTTILHDITTQKTLTWISTTIKTLKFAKGIHSDSELQILLGYIFYHLQPKLKMGANLPMCPSWSPYVVLHMQRGNYNFMEWNLPYINKPYGNNSDAKHFYSYLKLLIKMSIPPYLIFKISLRSFSW